LKVTNATDKGDLYQLTATIITPWLFYTIVNGVVIFSQISAGGTKIKAFGKLTHRSASEVMLNVQL
jgi:hypothetical protein